jgi:mannose/fructose/N-acetylgalactosamine-specific phosphotransferase system component IID
VVAVRPPLGRCLLRLFTVQGSWNYERMLGIGFGVAGEPLVRDLPPEQYRAAMARGAHFFNAHPYLCGLAVGAAARAEHDHVPPEQVERLRTALCGPLGSLGDRLVWAGWLPLNSGLALVGIALGMGWWAIAGFLAAYNLGHVGLRWWALRAGWAHGLRVVDALRHPFLQRAGAVLAPGMALATGAALPLAVGYLGGPFPGWARVLLAGAVAAGVILLRWRALGLTGLRLGLGFAAIGLVVGCVWR